MNFDPILPPADLVADIAVLHATVNGDTSGDKTRRLVEYMSQSEMVVQEMGLRTADFEEKAFASQLTEVYRASRGILLGAWRAIHGSELAGV